MTISALTDAMLTTPLHHLACHLKQMPLVWHKDPDVRDLGGG